MDPKHSHGPDRLDYQETSGDVTDVHASLLREKPEPTAKVTPIPLWLTAVCGGAILWSGAYLGLFHGGFRGDVFNERLSSPDLLFPQAASTTGGGPGGPAAPENLVTLGKTVYANCVTCHQASGTGVPGAFPPLAKSEWVNGSEKRVVGILLKGLNGPVSVEGKTFNGAMPPWESALSDKKIAAVLSYVRASFGNTAPEISEAKVKAARKELAAKKDSFTQPQLEEIPADATLPDDAPAAGAPAAGGGAPAAGGAAPAAATGGPSLATQIAAGKASYGLICVTCHQPNGLGLPAVFPPLAGSPFATGSPERLVAIVLKGIIGPIKVLDKPYLSAMPPQEGALTDQKIADVTTFVRNSFGNTAPAISADLVKATRAKFASRATSWSGEELENWKD